MVNFESKVSGVCGSSVNLRVGILEYPYTDRQRNLIIAATVLNIDMSIVMDFVIFDVPFFG